jgi:hypothetical protein
LPASAISTLSSSPAGNGVIPREKTRHDPCRYSLLPPRRAPEPRLRRATVITRALGMGANAASGPCRIRSPNVRSGPRNIFPGSNAIRFSFRNTPHGEARAPPSSAWRPMASGFLLAMTPTDWPTLPFALAPPSRRRVPGRMAPGAPRHPSRSHGCAPGSIMES